MIEIEPRWSCEFLPISAGRGRLSAPRPLTLATNSFLPSAETKTAPGYQPVGISPATRLKSGRSFAAQDFEPSRMTARQLFVPLAAYSVIPPGLRARALVPLPNGNRP